MTIHNAANIERSTSHILPKIGSTDGSNSAQSKLEDKVHQLCIYFLTGKLPYSKVSPTVSNLKNRATFPKEISVVIKYITETPKFSDIHPLEKAELIKAFQEELQQINIKIDNLWSNFQQSGLIPDKAFLETMHLEEDLTLIESILNTCFINTKNKDYSHSIKQIKTSLEIIYDIREYIEFEKICISGRKELTEIIPKLLDSIKSEINELNKDLFLPKPLYGEIHQKIHSLIKQLSLTKGTLNIHFEGARNELFDKSIERINTLSEILESLNQRTVFRMIEIQN